MQVDCRNCGAAMRLVREGVYFHCDHCGAFEFSQEGAHYVRTFDVKSKLDCPVCAVPMSLAAVSESQAWHCEKCRGVLFTLHGFQPAIGRLRAVHHGEDDGPGRIQPEEWDRKLTCPQCQGGMDHHPYLGPGAVLMDSCGTCRLIWVDHGEIDTLVQAPDPSTF